MIRLNKVISFIFIFFFITTSCSSQVLIKLDYKDLKKYGHSVTMFYSITSLKKLDSLICTSKKFNKEINILNAFGLPISNFSENICENKKEYFNDVKLILEGIKSRKFKIQNSKTLLALTFVKANYDFCLFFNSVNHWGSYHNRFKKCIVITKKPNICDFNEFDLKFLERIKKKIKRKI